MLRLEEKNENLRSEGFSLIELVFAMFFLTIIVLGVVTLQSSNLGMINSQNKEIQAHFYANQGAVVTEALGKGNLESTVGTQCPAFPTGPDDTCDIYLLTSSTPYQFSGTVPPPLDSLFSRTIRVKEVEANIYQITSIVAWEDSTGSHSINAKRIIYQ